MLGLIRRISNMNKNNLLSKYVFQIGTILSVMVLAASAMSSSFPANAFAQEGGSDTSENQDLVDVAVQPDTQVDVDVDVPVELSGVGHHLFAEAGEAVA